MFFSVFPRHPERGICKGMRGAKDPHHIEVQALFVLVLRYFLGSFAHRRTATVQDDALKKVVLGEVIECLEEIVCAYA